MLLQGHKQKVGKENEESNGGDLIYIKPEDEIFHKASKAPDKCSQHSSISMKYQVCIQCF